MQERCNSIANALELRLSCINPSKCEKRHVIQFCYQFHSPYSQASTSFYPETHFSEVHCGGFGLCWRQGHELTSDLFVLWTCKSYDLHIWFWSDVEYLQCVMLPSMCTISCARTLQNIYLCSVLTWYQGMSKIVDIVLITLSNAFFFKIFTWYMIRISLNFVLVLEGLINNNSALVQVIAWCWAGNIKL